jgi:hypothetical protein
MFGLCRDPPDDNLPKSYRMNRIVAACSTHG